MSSETAPAQLAKQIEEYLAAHPAAAVLEDGRVKFDMRSARYSLSESHGRCLFQLWSEDLNLVRTVVGVVQRAHCPRRHAAHGRDAAAEPGNCSQQRPPHADRAGYGAAQLSAPP